jgi:hypothetical protein
MGAIEFIAVAREEIIMADAQKPLTGGCQCGAVRYEINAGQLFAAHCQCNDCKKASGGGHSTVGAFPDSAVKFTGTMKAYASKADSGAEVEREFCPVCGGRLTLRSTNMPGMVMIMAGSLDDPSLITPEAAIYDKRRVGWDHFDPRLHLAPEMPQR